MRISTSGLLRPGYASLSSRRCPKTFCKPVRAHFSKQPTLPQPVALPVILSPGTQAGVTRTDTDTDGEVQ